MSLKLNTASGGSITLQEADTASNLTLTVPAQAGSIVTANSSGNVGIGTSSPARKLQVHESSAGTNAYIQLSNATTGATSTDGFQVIVGTSSETILAQRENAEMQFWTNNTEQARITAAGNFQFNSGYGSAATAYGCRAWVNFNGTGTVAIRGSGNVSSITDRSTGSYDINFSTAMPDINYSVIGTSGDVGSWGTVFHTSQMNIVTTSAVQILLSNNNGTSRVDDSWVNVAIFR